MDANIKILADAIESLRPTSNIFKDYLFPIGSAFFSSLLGAFIAYIFFKYQERISIEKDKINTANKWILIAEGALTNLIAIKDSINQLKLKNQDKVDAIKARYAQKQQARRESGQQTKLLSLVRKINQQKLQPEFQKLANELKGGFRNAQWRNSYSHGSKAERFRCGNSL